VYRRIPPLDSQPAPDGKVGVSKLRTFADTIRDAKTNDLASLKTYLDNNGGGSSGGKGWVSMCMVGRLRCEKGSRGSLFWLVWVTRFALTQLAIMTRVLRL